VAEHRILGSVWAETEGTLLIYERERMKRRRYIWLLDMNEGTSRQWFEMDENDRYNNPGSPIYTQLENGRYAIKVEDGAMYFRGSGGTPEGDRPFVDRRNIETGETERLFRCAKEKYESFVGFGEEPNSFIMRSESSAGSS
jgi:dipeptidyl aminopeptidase/acylaminoacyl peptidase